MRKRRLRVFIDQPAGHHEVACHPVSSVFGQRAQIAAYGRIKIARIDVFR